MAVSKKFSLGVIFASASLTIMAGSIIAPVLNLMRDALGVAPASVGLIITTHGLFMALSSPLMGSLIDRKGARRPYIIALICFGLAGGSGLLISSFWVLLLSRACLGIALAGIFAGINVLILNMYEGNERDRVMGWRGSAQSFGGVIWPLIGGTLGGFSWHFPFAVYMLAIPVGLLAIAAVPEPAIHQQARQQSSVRTSVFRVFQDSPVLLVIYGLMFFGNVLLYSIIIFLPQLLESFGITSTFQIGLFITAMTGSAGVTAFIYGKIRSRFTYRVIVTIAVALWTVAFTTISQAPGSRIIAMAVALFGISQGLILPTVMVWIGEAVPPSFRGRFSSYLGTFGFIGQFLSPILFAPVFMLVGLRGVFVVGAGVGAAWFLLLLFGLGRAKKIGS
ncbi:MAG: MFS transporter [Desulfobacterales bacterium]|jgi:ACDE family multidrug resistance protein